MKATDDLEEIRYPIGRVQIATAVSPADRSRWITQMAEAPARLRAALTGLSDQQLDRRYRDGGWTLRQVAHHLADEHLKEKRITGSFRADSSFEVLSILSEMYNMTMQKNGNNIILTSKLKHQ